MPSYNAPLRDMRFLLHDVFEGPTTWGRLPNLAARVDADTANAILEEGAKIAEHLLAPLNRTGDEQGASWSDGHVTTPTGFREAYATFSAGGWNGITGSPEYGGMGLPKMLSVQLEEMFYASNSGFSLYTVLSVSAGMTLEAHASEAIQKRYLPQLYAGTWSGTMCLTEAHAGTDLGMIRTRAIPQADGTYQISGTKIFITSGEHDLTENIIHLVLAKLPDAPPGPKGISLFLVPKVLVNDDGSLGTRNAVSCGSLENKMGVKASATCVMNFDGATGWLVGELNKGLAAMFTMMNHQRVSCGQQGIGCADAAYQVALSYARERLQGRAPQGAMAPDRPADPILGHPDVRRMLMTSKAMTEAGRALSTYLGMQLDLAKDSEDMEKRSRADALSALLTPVAKAFNSDTGMDSCLLSQQVLGGHGYIREWGQEQLVRDCRIAKIYEGTNGIQALDLVGRKVLSDQGATLELFLTEVSSFANDHRPLHHQDLVEAVCLVRNVTSWLLQSAKRNACEAGAASMEYLHLLGYLAYGYMWARMSAVAQTYLASAPDFHGAKLATAAFYFSRLMPRMLSLEQAIRAGAAPLHALKDHQF